MTHDEMIAVIKADERGEKIQAFAHEGEKDHEMGWVEVRPNFDFYRCDFRVKPEAREWWITCDQIDADGRVVNPVFYDHLPAWNNRKTIHVREVLP